MAISRPLPFAEAEATRRRITDSFTPGAAWGVTVIARLTTCLLLAFTVGMLIARTAGAVRGGSVAYIEQYGEAAQARLLDPERGYDRPLHDFTDCQIAWLDHDRVLLTSTPPGARHQVAAVSFSRDTQLLTGIGAPAVVLRGAHNEAPARSPDGRFFAYAANRAQENTIYRVEVETGIVQSIGVVPMWVTRLAWSPEPGSDSSDSGSGSPNLTNGTRLVAEGVRDNRYAAVYLLIDSEVALLPDARAAVWSPDGAQVVYAAQRAGQLDLYTHRIADAAETRLTEDAAVDGLPVWSPDGLSIAYISGNAQTRQLMRLDLAEGTRRALTPPDYADVSALAWSPDSTRLIMSARPAHVASQFRLLVPYDLVLVDARGIEQVRRVREGQGVYVNNFSRFCALAWSR